MPVVQIRDVPEETLQAIKSRAAERGQTLTAYLLTELDRLAARPTNAELVDRMARRDRRAGPTVADTGRRDPQDPSGSMTVIAKLA